MTPVLYNAGLSSSPNDVDSVSVELHDPLVPADVLATSNGILHVDGTLNVVFPAFTFNQSYYLVVRHRNTIATWSKVPVTLSTLTVYDFAH